MELEEQIRALLERELPGAVVDIRRAEDTDKIGGHVIWEGFAGYDSRKRQNRVFGLLRRNMSAAEAQDNLSYIFTYTPAEYDQLQAA
jgi:acid stress-induced BolA-like protein IbaG/YrbA